jgi:Ca2+-dependent lipid-binding protein
VKITADGQTNQTSTQSDTYYPYWDEYVVSASAGYLINTGMDVYVYDDDFTPDELMGSCVVQLTEQVLLSGAGFVSSCGSEGNINKLSFKFTAQ